MIGTQTANRSNIAFIDNAPVLGRLLKATAGRLGSRGLFVLSDPEELATLLETEQIGKVYCDWRMPRRNGIEVLQDIRRTAPAIECILMTGWRSELTSEQEESLRRQGIRVEDKEVISEAWLAAELGVQRPNRPQEPPDAAEATTSVEPENQSEALAVARLERDRLRSVVDQQRVVISKVSEGLVHDLARVPKGEGALLFGTGDGLTVGQVIQNINDQTPLGLRLLEIDRQMQFRFGTKLK